MILDSFKLNNAIIQIQYKNAFELWDHAGAVARGLSTIWPDLSLSEGQPNQQVLEGKGVNIQTGFTKSTITLSGDKALEQRKVQQITKTFEVWRDELGLGELLRVSMRVIYCKEFPSMKEANAELIALNLVRWPNSKVFDQPIDSDLNGFEIQYRFEDQNSFSLLKLKAEQLRLELDFNPDFVDESEIRKTKNRMIIDFDRGILGSVNAEKLRMDDWIKGFQHILRRDIEKVIKGQE